MFTTINAVKRAMREVLYDGGKGREKIEELNEEIERLKVNIQELESKKRIEEEEIRHLVKMKEEKNSIELQKKEIEMQKKFNEQEMKMQSNYHEKVLETIEDSRKESRELYSKIMERLPNVNVRMEKQL